MKLKYRIKEWSIPFTKTYFTAQYKIFGIWININLLQTGKLIKSKSTICETFKEAQKRINIHKLNMIRAKWWMNKIGIIIWKDN